MLHERGHTLRAIYLEVGNVLAPQGGAIVDKSDRVVGARAPQRLEELHAGRARAVDQDGSELSPHVVLGELDADAPEHPARHLARPPDEGRAEDRIEDDDGARHELDSRRVCARELDAREKHEQRPNQGGEADRNGNAHGSQTADKTRHQAVEPKLEEGCHTNRGRRAEYEKQLPGGRHVRLAQPQRHGQPKGEPEQEEVGGGEDGALGIAAEADQAQQPLAHQCLERRPRLETGHASTTKTLSNTKSLTSGRAAGCSSILECTRSALGAPSPCRQS